MEDNDEDNIYIYSEDSEQPEQLDNSGPNFSQSDPSYIPEGSDAEKQGDISVSEETGSMFVILLKIMLNPIEGWKSVRRKKIPSELVARKCFYPLVALVSLAQFFQLIYSSRDGFALLIENVIITFVSFFFGYFCSFLLLRVVLHLLGSSSIDTNFGKVFILFNLSTLCIFFTLTEIFPMLWAILIFLPLWTVYLICRGARFFYFPEKRQILSTASLCLGIIGCPLMLAWILESILPHIK